MPKGVKRLSYRATYQPSQANQAAHWAGFEFVGGPWQVIYKGPWGQIQVWAESEAEGRRVIEHACAGGAINPQHPQGEWFVVRVASPRYAKPTRYRTMVRFGSPVVTCRQGPNGSPQI